MLDRARALAVDLALEAIERKVGVGLGATAPGWVRDRIGDILEEQARRRGVTVIAAVQHLIVDRQAVEEIVAALRVGETRFYRDPEGWQAIAAALDRLPDGPIAGLSAGCSTGEEAYTLAMVLAHAGRRFSVLGVDRSEQAVAAAREAAYAAGAARHLPPPLVERYCQTEGGILRVRPEMRALVTFEPCDLVKTVPHGGFHIILFKNVLLYLASPAGETVARRLAAELDPRGLLFTAASEVPRVRAAGLSTLRMTAHVTAFTAAGAAGDGG